MAESMLNGYPNAPRWLDSIEPKNRGLDLLGLRLPVQTIGNSLMDGITTITPSIRNFSIRTWLVWSYANARRPDDWSTFREFAAHAEACVALGNHLAETGAQGVVGIDEAPRLLESSGERIQLKPLVAQLATQNYANPSDELGLTFTRETGIPGITAERGVPLAELVDQYLASSQIGKALRRGETLADVSLSDLREFGSLAALNSLSGDEAGFLVEAIVPSNPRPAELPRLSTYTALMALTDWLERPPKEAEFFSAMAKPGSDLPGVLTRIRDGWVRYLVRDSLAVCHEAVLASVVLGLSTLQGNQSSTVNRDDVVVWLLGQVAAEQKSLAKLGVTLPPGAIESWTFRAVADAVRDATQPGDRETGFIDRWPGELQEWALGNLALSSGAGAPIFLPIAWLLAQRRAQAEIEESTADSVVYSHQGWPRIGLEQVVFPQLAKFIADDWPFIRAVEALIQRTVDQHLRIAWSRLRSERPPRDVAVLVSDGQRWCQRKSFRAGRTASRLSQATSWLRQLVLIDDSGLTATGRSVLDRSLKALEPGP